MGRRVLVVSGAWLGGLAEGLGEEGGELFYDWADVLLLVVKVDVAAPSIQWSSSGPTALWNASTLIQEVTARVPAIISNGRCPISGTKANAQGRYEAQIAQAIPANDAELRAAIISAITLSITVSRHPIESDELATADPAQVIQLLRPACFRWQTAPGDSGAPG